MSQHLSHRLELTNTLHGDRLYACHPSYEAGLDHKVTDSTRVTRRMEQGSIATIRFKSRRLGAEQISTKVLHAIGGGLTVEPRAKLPLHKTHTEFAQDLTNSQYGLKAW